jgi:4'-phosphopantetheinyl transferase
MREEAQQLSAEVISRFTPGSGAEEVQIWRGFLDLTVSEIDGLFGLLSEDEQLRARRFYFQRDRVRFVAARAMLRIVLGDYLGLDPQRLFFRYGAWGKPSLGGECDKDSVRFNLSHSGSVAFLGITRGAEIGVDLEFIREDFATMEIAQDFFSPGELAALRALPVEMRVRGFFNCWTRKEAFIKARGDGLSLPLDKFEVSLAPGDPAKLLRTEFDPEEANRWILQDLSLDDHRFVGAVAVEKVFRQPPG